MKHVIAKILLLILCLPASSQPLEIDDKKIYSLPPEISKFRYWYGNVSSGPIIYLGTEDISGFETELHLHFFKGKISKTLLILGPSGIDEENCVKKYREVVKALNQKYGHYEYQRVIKDPIVDDLVSVSICTPIKLELYDITTHWRLKDYTVVASILGDEDGWYIEIEYSKKSTRAKSELKKIL